MTHTDQPSRRPPPAPSHPAAPSARARGAGRGKAASGVSPMVAQQIDENLKRLYRQQVEQALPPELQALVSRLRDGAPDRGGEGRG